jgi:ribonuclease HII
MKADAAPRLVAGIDEAGRGPLAGPVVAAAVILRNGQCIDGLADSKVLSASRRAYLFDRIRNEALAFAIAWADAGEIDRLNILQATMLAMRRAILGLAFRPAVVEVDGNRLPDLRFGEYSPEGIAIVGGDRLVASISAASILAKVHRDRLLQRVDSLYPEYGFAQHKGYGTRAHRDSIGRHGPCPYHRRTFDPVRSMLLQAPDRALGLSPGSFKSS